MAEDTSPSTLLLRIKTLEARVDQLVVAAHKAHSVISSMDISNRDYERVEDELLNAKQEHCFGSFGNAAVDGLGQTFIEWPDLALARDDLAQALQVGGP